MASTSFNWISEPCFMDMEDSQNPITVPDVFSPGAQFKLVLKAGFSSSYAVSNVSGTPVAWTRSSCVLTEEGSDWPIGSTVKTPIHSTVARSTFESAARRAFVNLLRTPRYLAGSLNDAEGTLLCTVKIYRIPGQLTDGHDLLIFDVNDPRSGKLTNGTGYGHS
jgi:hypothetical protein